MERYVVATRLKPGAAPAAEELLSAGPPFDPGEAGLSAHAAYISNDYVFLVFEGEACTCDSASAREGACDRSEPLARHRLGAAFRDRRRTSGRSLSLPLASRSVGITCVLTRVSASTRDLGAAWPRRRPVGL